MRSLSIGREPSESKRSTGASWDLWIVGAWWLLIVFVGFARTDYMGDGLRHLEPIVAGGGPRLGEPRWLLFPAFLYGLLRPFFVLGLATNVESLAHVMMGATVLAGGAYMLALRSCLVAAGIEPRRRAAALALAGCCAAFFFSSTDLMEPIFGATLVVCALAWAARRVARPTATADDHRRALVGAAAVIALAALMYQGLVLALGLLPLVIPRPTFRDRRAQLQCLAVLAAIPVVMVGALMWSGNALPHALGRALQGEENHIYSGYLKKPGLMPRIVALIGGPAQGLVTISGFRGFNGLLAGLRSASERRASLTQLGQFAVGGSLVVFGLWGAVRRRDGALFLGFAALMILPVVRCQQYGYIKYYILLAVLVAFAAARARPWFVALLAGALFLLNVEPTLARIPEARRHYRARVDDYAKADARSCWMTTSWIPPVGFRWPGRVCAVLGSFASGHGDNERDVTATAHAAMTGCLDACFCHASGIFTDDMLDPGVAPLIEDFARQFKYTAFDLGEIALPPERAERVSAAGVDAPVYRYPADEQRRICDRLTKALETRR